MIHHQKEGSLGKITRLIKSEAGAWLPLFALAFFIKFLWEIKLLD